MIYSCSAVNSLRASVWGLTRLCKLEYEDFRMMVEERLQVRGTQSLRPGQDAWRGVWERAACPPVVPPSSLQRLLEQGGAGPPHFHQLQRSQAQECSSKSFPWCSFLLQLRNATCPQVKLTVSFVRVLSRPSEFSPAALRLEGSQRRSLSCMRNQRCGKFGEGLQDLLYERHESTLSTPAHLLETLVDVYMCRCS